MIELKNVTVTSNNTGQNTPRQTPLLSDGQILLMLNLSDTTFVFRVVLILAIADIKTFRQNV